MTPIERYMDRIQPRLLEDLTQEEAESVKLLVGSPGMAVLLGLLESEQRANGLILATLGLGSAENACAASVIQGRIQGIARVKQTLLELYPQDPTNDGAN